MSLPLPSVSSVRMQAKGLVQLAATLAARGPAVLGRSSRISAAALEHYAAAAHQRHVRWMRRLRSLQRAAAPMTGARAWLEEILVAEALPRVWAAVLCADALLRQDARSISAVCRTLEQHAAARHRALRLLAGSARCLTFRDAAELNQLHRSLSRWIDLLVAHVQQNGAIAQAAQAPASPVDVCQFAMEPERAREFAEDLAQQHAAGLGPSSLAMAIVSLRTLLNRQLRGASPNGRLNHVVATSIVACFPADMFDATGPYRSLWTARLTHRTADAERMIGQMLAE
jgi:hypothetical protein